jgi:hypothetical protein
MSLCVYPLIRSKGASIMETTILNATEYRNVSLALLRESATNPRRVFEETALQELTLLRPVVLVN